MNQEIEKRIVAMYFDNQDFEKNAKQTLDTLGQLKDNLNLEDSVKGFEELDKAGKKLNLNNVKSNINNMKSSLGGFQNVLNKAFTIGTAPVRALENFFGTFQSYVGRFIGFDLASKFVSSLENALRQLTVAPIEAGWSMYESTIDSVKTIMSGTLQTYSKSMSEASDDWVYNEEEHMEFVKGHLNELSKYAQQTVFSLSDMTSNIGKFTNNAVSLEDAVPAMEGIANMTAKAGQGAREASMAMYNFSQAIGVGKMTSIDWKSIENANIATTELKDAFIQTAAAGGKLQKEVTKLADGTEVVKYFKTVDKNGKKLAKNKWVEISAQNFRDTLSEGWLDRDTMLKVMKVYSGTIKNKQELYDMGFDMNNEELIDYLLKIGEEAATAATQVRTFSKMWDAMTESVQSGWADSMQLIFGDMFEATEFWTKINDEIGEVLDKSANERNKMLHEWRGEVYNSEKEIWEKQEGAYDGRQDLINGIYELIAAAKSLGSTFSSAWEGVFGKTDGKKLQEITKRFHDLTTSFNEWLGGAKDSNGETRLDKIQKGLRGVFSILKAVGNVFKTVFNVVKKVAAPLADFFINLFGDIGGFFDGLGDLNAGQVIAKLREGLHKVWEAIAKLFEPEDIYDEFGKKTGKKKTPIAKFLESTFGSIANDVRQWFQDNDLSGVWNALEDAWEWLKGIWEKIASWEGWAAIGAFFTNIYAAVRDYFAPKEAKRYVGSSVESYMADSPFISSVKRIWERVKNVWNSITGWSGWASIAKFFSDVGSWINEKYNLAVNFFTTPTDNGKTGFVNWLESLLGKIEAAWQPILDWPGWEQVGTFFSDAGKWIEDRVTQAIDFFAEPTDNGKTGFSNWLDDVLTMLNTFWQPVYNWEGWAAIAQFFSDAGAWIEGVVGTAINFFAEPTDNGETGFANWFNSIKETLNTAWESVIGWEGWTAVGQFFTDIGTWIHDQFGYVIDWFSKPTDDEGTTGFSQWLASVKEWFDTAWLDIYNWDGWDAIGQFFSDIGEWIKTRCGVAIDWFTEPTDNGKTGFVTWLEGVAAEISRIWGIIYNWPGWKDIAKFFTDTWNWIMGLFTDDGDDPSEVKKSRKSKSKLSEIKLKARAAAKDATDASKELSFFERILKAIGDFVDGLVSSLSGTDMTKFTEFFKALGTFFNGLLDIVAKVLDTVGKFLSATAEGGLGAGWQSLEGDGQTVVWITVITTILSYLGDFLKARWLSKIDTGESVAHKLFEIGAALLMVALALGVISLIPTEKIISGGIVLAVILAAMIPITANLAEMAKQNATNPTERILSKVVSTVEKLGTIAIVMALLPGIIKAFGEAKKECPDLNGLDIAETLVGLALAIVALFAGFALVNKLIGNQKANWGNSGVMAKIAVWLLVLTAVLTGLGYVSHELIGSKTVLESLKDAKEVLTLVGATLGGLIGGFLGGVIAPIREAFGYQSPEQQIESSINIIESLTQRLDYFTPDRIYGINRILNTIGMLGSTVNNVPDSGKILAFATALDPMATAIMHMGITLAGFTDEKPGEKGLSVSEVEENILKVAGIIRAFSIPSDMNLASAQGFIDAIRTLNHEMTTEDFHAFAELVNNFVYEFDKATGPNGSAMAKMTGNLLSNLSEAIRIGLSIGSGTVGPFDAIPIIDAIVLAIEGGKDRIADAVHNAIQNGINEAGWSGDDGAGTGFTVPSLDLSGFFTEFSEGLQNPLAGFLGGSNTLGSLGGLLWGSGGNKENPEANSLYGMLGGLQSYVDTYEIPDIGSKITDSMTIKDAEGNEIDFVSFIQGNLDEMSKALAEADSNFEITIIPTLDWSRLTPEAIQQQLGDMPIELPFNLGDTALKMDYSGLFAELGLGFIQDELTSIENAIDDERVAVVNAIDAMGVRIDGISSSIRSLKLYLDTGALVGGITPYVDLMLGRRAALAARTGVTFP